MSDIFETNIKGIFFDKITHRFYVWVNGKKKTSYCKNNLIKYLR